MDVGSLIPAASRRPFIIAGPCVLEGEEMALRVAAALADWTAERQLFFIFKSSYVKANRTSAESYAGPGLEEGLRILAKVRREIGVPVLTDVHCIQEVEPAAAVVDLLQIPAFLCRQTRLIQAAAQAATAINIKKGQFLAMRDIRHAVAKAREVKAGCEVLLTERGSFFGYHDLVVDMRAVAYMRSLECRVVFDATHALQHPGRGGSREFARPLARAALGAGAEGIFAEVHPDPDRALSDSTTQFPLEWVPDLLAEWGRLGELVKELEEKDDPGHAGGIGPTAQTATQPEKK
jgi:2-dehydro-3-deoxyphosphooctonate aldolase (KDO 8-P synthase)